MPILYLTNDLMFSSQVVSAAEQRGLDVELIGDADALVARAQETDVQLVLIDLTAPGADPPKIVSALRLHPSGATRVVAYGPHVDEAVLAAAVESGCDLVLSRGQFHQQFPILLDAVE